MSRKFTENDNITSRLRFIAAALFIFSALAMLSVRASGQGRAEAQGKAELPGAQQIVCEKEYVNFAFGRVRRGIYVDREGKVYSYAYKRGEAMWRQSEDNIYTEEELLEKYSHGKQLVARVKQRELNAKRKLILKASTGLYSDKIRRGADQGTYTSVCYLYDVATGKYRGVTLQTTGDQRYENLSEAAKTLSTWLDSLAAQRRAPAQLKPQ
jgi:hypothetical protein